ncbi:MAG: sulfatase [Saprospiraceae bacterium]|nr:sulfatase [Saprospiraceae bacterium]
MSNPAKKVFSLLPFAFIGIGVLSVLLFSSHKSVPANKPNFIFILTDDQGWTSTSQLMDDKLPNSKSDYFETLQFERFAAKGMRFTNGYAPCALCCPTRRSIQFGQTPARQGDADFKQNYHPDFKKVTAIPQMLKSISPEYRAAHFGKWDLRADIFPEDLGYDESDGDTGNNNGDMNSTKKTKWSDLFLNNDPKRIESITKRALNFMNRQAKSGHPFYLQVSHYATHVDFQTREKTYEKYSNKTKGAIHNNPGYAGMLEDLDTGIGKLLDMVDKLGIGDNTYIILMTDNGGVEFIPPVKNKFDHPSTFARKTRNYPLRGGKWTLYEGGIRVPFMVIGPGIKPGSQSDVPVTGWDILPTLSDLAENKHALPPSLDGKSLKSLFASSSTDPFKRENDQLVFHYFGNAHSSIRVGDYKLIKFWKSKKVELYDLKNDLGELNDISSSNKPKVKELESRLMTYLESVHAEVLYPSKNAGKKETDDDSED